MSAALTTALVLMPLMTPVAQAKMGVSHQVLSSEVATGLKKDTENSVTTSSKKHTIEKTDTQLAKGVTEEKLTYNNSKGERTVMQTVSVDLKGTGASLYAGTPDDGKGFARQKVTDQVKAAEKNGHQVVAGVNADFFSMTTGEPSGVVVKNGEVLHDKKPGNKESFFGITKDGTPMIGDQDLYLKVSKEQGFKQALGGLGILVKDGEINKDFKGMDDERSARTAIGIRKDKTVFFVTIDGKQSGYSNGISDLELAQTMKDQGAVDSLNLDSGGSATYLSRTPGDKTVSLKNRPSDGDERTVANSWLILTDEESDHKFNSAYVTPKDKVYSPKSEVDFSAKGVDKAGYNADLPTSELSWSINDKTLGSIDEKSGKFLSSGKPGDVTATLSKGGKEVGSSTITVAIPDEIDFLNKSVSLKTGSTHSLGMKVRYKDRDVILKPNDIVWNVPKEIGKMNDKNQLETASGHAKGTVTATISGTKVSNSLDVEIGQLPEVLYDFEKGLGDWKVDSSKRGEVNKLDLASEANGQVRFGDHALEVKFGFSTAQKESTLGAYAGPAEKKDIPGSPTAIGMWVYGTPESQGYWLRSQIYDGKGTPKPLNFTDESTGIDWLGWKYVEAQIPDNYEGPFATFPNQVVRVMLLKSGTAGHAMRNGSIFVDNVRAVYGANVDDLKSPIVDSISADGGSYSGNKLTITTKIHDDMKDPNATGIDWDRNKIYIDGKDYTVDGSRYSYDKDGNFTVKNYQFADGIHHIRVSIFDRFGNRTDKDAYFEIHAGNKTRVSFQASNDSKTKLGGTASFDLNADDLSNIKSGEFTVQLAKGFPVKSVEFPNESKDNSFDYDKESGILKIHVKDTTGSKDVKGSLAHITVDVPKNTPSGMKLSYQLVTGTAKFGDLNDNADIVNTFSSKPSDLAIQADYGLVMNQYIVGEKGSLKVIGSDQKAVSGATIVMTSADGKAEEIGKTDDEGNLESEKLTKKEGHFKLTATKDGSSSFETAAQAFTPVKDEKPSNLLAGATQDPTTQKTITWFSNPVKGNTETIMQVATDADFKSKGDEAFRNYNGERKVFTYVSDSKAVRVNSVTAKGLKPGTTYTYRVGDGTTWSETRHFKTLTDSDHLSFNVFGDTQVNASDQLGDFDKIIQHLETAKDKPDFAIHVGDFNDDQSIFNEADVTSQMFDKHPVYDSLDMIHVLGNHEYMGDDGSKATMMLGTPAHNGAAVNRKGTFSVDYGNMHIASLGWTDDAEEMKQELDWLRKDMKDSKKTWKVVATHQPPYNKNPADSRSTMFNKMLPPVCDELGIDVVFSGHDHSYGRTKPLVAGKENKNGTTYISAGHTGDKTYDILPNEKSVWDYIQKPEEKKQKVYLSVQVVGGKMNLITRDPDDKEVDKATLTAHSMQDSGQKPGTSAGSGNTDKPGSNTGSGSAGKPGSGNGGHTDGSNTGDTNKPGSGSNSNNGHKPGITKPGSGNDGHTDGSNTGDTNKPGSGSNSNGGHKPGVTKPGSGSNSGNTTGTHTGINKPTLTGNKPGLSTETGANHNSTIPTSNGGNHNNSMSGTGSHYSTSANEQPVQHRNKLLEKVVALKGIALYKTVNFSKKNRIISYTKQNRMHRPEFKVLGISKSKDGHLRYHVRDLNKNSKGYGKTGYITASSKYVQSAEYTKKVKLLTVINIHGIKSYLNAKLTGKAKHHYNQGQFLKVKRIVHQGRTVKFQLTNGQYVSANKHDVQAGKVNKPKSVTAKTTINLYGDTNFKHKLRHVPSGTKLKIKGWDYSDKGILHYRVQGGFITASHSLIK
ncbi:phosphodiester glycosidase family protein [Levilactobacillus enshiensis]|uniref:phosphodiester glycosidase family protein n=1 Tax=Levilactobacillus enshiensis TaxID=2590213 RepID=UPI00117B3EBE|nr:phosphodiester glycosidase family protein [Levilactobacillus enshiensis]